LLPVGQKIVALQGFGWNKDKPAAASGTKTAISFMLPILQKPIDKNKENYMPTYFLSNNV
jgi:hypothetical protein